MKCPRRIVVQEEIESPSFREKFYYLALEAGENVHAVVTAKSKSDSTHNHRAVAQMEGRGSRTSKDLNMSGTMAHGESSTNKKNAGSEGDRESDSIRQRVKKALYDLETRERLLNDMEDAKESQKQYLETQAVVAKDVVLENKNLIKHFNQH